MQKYKIEEKLQNYNLKLETIQQVASDKLSNHLTKI